MAVETKGAEGFPWVAEALKDLNQEPDDINERPCLVTFMDKDCCSSEKREKVIQMLQPLAKEYRQMVSFFYVKEAGEVSSQIRAMIGQEDCPLLAIVDIPDNGGYYLSESKEISEAAVRALVDGFANKQIERKQMVA